MREAWETYARLVIQADINLAYLPALEVNRKYERGHANRKTFTVIRS